MTGIRTGPTQAYADEYARANKKIDKIAASLVTEIQAMGFEARTFKASQRTDPDYRFHKGHNCGICAAVCPFRKIKREFSSHDEPGSLPYCQRETLLIETKL